MEMELESQDQRKHFREITQFKSVLMLLKVNIPQQMEPQVMNHVKLAAVDASQNLVWTVGVVPQDTNHACGVRQFFTAAP